jgi:hypothetical protein
MNKLVVGYDVDLISTIKFILSLSLLYSDVIDVVPEGIVIII